MTLPHPSARPARHQVVAVVALTGPQRAHVQIQDGGTPEATASMAVGRALLYLRTQAAAAQLGALADRADMSVMRLPPQLPIQPRQDRPDDAEVSIVTHLRGAPGGVVRVMPQTRPRMPYLHLQIGELVFHLHDQLAARACISTLRRVAELGGQLGIADSRRALAQQPTAPQLAGADADRARAELAQPEDSSDPADSTAQVHPSPTDAALTSAQAVLAHAQDMLAQLQSVQRASATFTAPSPNTSKPAQRRSAATSSPPPQRTTEPPTPAPRPPARPTSGRNPTR